MSEERPASPPPHPPRTPGPADQTACSGPPFSSTYSSDGSSGGNRLPPSPLREPYQTRSRSLLVLMRQPVRRKTPRLIRRTQRAHCCTHRRTGSHHPPAPNRRPFRRMKRLRPVCCLNRMLHPRTVYFRNRTLYRRTVYPRMSRMKRISSLRSGQIHISPSHMSVSRHHK